MKLINNDCINALKEIPEYSVDLLLTDPPYNVSRDNNFSEGWRVKRQGLDFGEWDKGFDLVSWIPLAAKTLKDNSSVIIFNAWENLGVIKQACEENNIVIKRCIVLSKSNPAPFNRDRMFVNDVEFALWGVYHHNKKPTGWVFNREEPIEKCVMNTTVQSSKLHPTMKDLKIIEKLMRLLSVEGGVVLDPFMGSGTTGVAAKKLGRDFIGIEIDEKYFNIAKERISDYGEVN